MLFEDMKKFYMAIGFLNEFANRGFSVGYPEDYYMPCFIGIGKPEENAPIPKQKDIDIKDRIHWDKYFPRSRNCIFYRYSPPRQLSLPHRIPANHAY